MAEEKADLTVLFSSMHHADELGRISAAFLEQGRTRHVLGCTGETIIGEDREVEGSPALAVWSITLPGVTIEPVRLGEPGESPTAWAEDLDDPAKAVMLLLGDPFSFQTDDFLKQLNTEIRGLRVVGGMASGSQVPRANQLVLDGKAFHDGAVAMLLSGPVAVRTVVSQGCRPIGRTMIVTKAEQNIIRELGRRPALEVLRDMFQELSPDDQRQIQDGLHIGRVINEYQESFHRGDFLVRNVIGRRRLRGHPDHRPGPRRADRPVPRPRRRDRRRRPAREPLPAPRASRPIARPPRVPCSSLATAAAPASSTPPTTT